MPCSNILLSHKVLLVQLQILFEFLLMRSSLTFIFSASLPHAKANQESTHVNVAHAQIAILLMCCSRSCFHVCRKSLKCWNPKPRDRMLNVEVKVWYSFLECQPSLHEVQGPNVDSKSQAFTMPSTQTILGSEWFSSIDLWYPMVEITANYRTIFMIHLWIY